MQRDDTEFKNFANAVKDMVTQRVIRETKGCNFDFIKGAVEELSPEQIK